MSKVLQPVLMIFLELSHPKISEWRCVERRVRRKIQTTESKNVMYLHTVFQRERKRKNLVK